MNTGCWRFRMAAIAASLTAMLLSSGVALAHSASVSDPSVVIARDITTRASCHLVYGEVQNGKHVILGSTVCPARTIVESFILRLSQARSMGEAYVVLPRRNSSSQVLAHVKQQIFALMAAKGKRPFSGKESPNPFIHPHSCSGSYYVYGYWDPDASTELYSRMNYQRCSDGRSLYLTNSYIQLDSGHSYYWDHDQYASGNWGRGCTLISTNGDTGGLNSTHTKGYYYEPYVTNGSGCFPWDSYIYTDIGPAN